MDELNNTTTEEMDGTNAAAEASTDTKEVPPGTEQNDSDQTPPAPEKKYTDADVDRIIAKKIAQERNRMQKLFADDQQESELDRREREVTKRELRADAMEALAHDGFPCSLADTFNYNSKEAFDESYKTLTDAFQKAVNEKVRNIFMFDDRVAHEVPKVGTGAPPDQSRAAFFSGEK